MFYHCPDPELFSLIETCLFVINRCKMCDISEDTRFLLDGISDKLNQVKSKCDLMPF